mgnify:CR=1 FL=1
MRPSVRDSDTGRKISLDRQRPGKLNEPDDGGNTKGNTLALNVVRQERQSDVHFCPNARVNESVGEHCSGLRG